MDVSRYKHVIMVLLLMFTSVYATHTNILRSLNAPVTSSTQHPTTTYQVSHATDGSTSTDSGACQCCAATKYQHDPSIQIDLGRLYRVSMIEVTGRTDIKDDPFEGMHIYLHTQPEWQQNLAGNVTIPNVTGSVPYYNGTLENPVIARYVTLQLSGFVLLCVCEVSIYSRDCHSGYYGVSCGETCGRCLNNEVCDHVTGACTKCEAGYKGAVCKDECPAGTFGQDCSSICRCLNNVTCDHVTGRCPGDRCDLGWHGLNCSKRCDDGRFGENCKELCGNCFNNVTCDKRDGTCTSCSSGYIGQQCKHECPTGTYGKNCSGTCGNCRDRCDFINGTCTTGCQDGYLGTVCQENCTEGFYGYNCSSACGHCLANNTCTFTTGHCEGGCEEGYYGDLCTKEPLTSEPDTPASSAGTVGAAVGTTLAVICVAVVVIVIIVIRRRRETPYVDARLKQDKHMNLVTIDDDLEDADPSGLYAKPNRPGKLTMSDEITGKKQGPSINGALRSDSQENLADIDDEKEANIDRSEYYSFEPKKIQICKLLDYLTNQSQQNNQTLVDEFELLNKCPIEPATVARAEINAPKNRYRGFYAYDKSRVILERPASEGTDYINANYIKGYNKEKKFIAAQGPTDAMLNDFMLMLYQQKCAIVVMLTNVYEMGVRKCLQYWPEKGEETFGDITVILQDEDNDNIDYVIRRIKLKKNNGPERSLRQYHFKAWPDKDVPNNTWCLVNFWRAVDSVAHKLKTPILVHCSAGVGRTGTFIALDNMFYQAQATGAVSPYEVVRKLRQQRMKLVQTQDQYIYLHEAVSEALMFGPKPITSNRFMELYTFMNEPDQKGELKYKRQLKLINESLDNTKAVQQIEYSNVDCSVDDDGKILVRVGDGSTWTPVLGASFLPLITGYQACVIATSPGPNDTENFWHLVSQLRITAVVMATSPNHPLYQTSYCLGINDHAEFGQMRVHKMPHTEHPKATTFSHSKSERDQRELLQFEVPSCSQRSDIPRDTEAVIDVLMAVVDWNCRNGTSEGPILIHSGDGGLTAGLMAVLLNEILRMKLRNSVINIVESVKTMKQVNRNIVTTPEQLGFCYDGLHEMCREKMYSNGEQQ